MDHKVFEQVSNVATLPGIQQAAYDPSKPSLQPMTTDVDHPGTTLV